MTPIVPPGSPRCTAARFGEGRGPSLRRLRGPTLVAGLFLAACGSGAGDAAPRESAADTSGELPTAGTERFPLVPASAAIDQVNRLPRNPLTEAIEADSATAERIRFGYRVARDPRAFGAAEFVGNDLACFSCHMNGGQREGALPLVGVAGLFPQFRNRDDRMVSLRERIDGCFMRSMNGTPPPPDHPVALALQAYIHWLSEGQPEGESPPWRGQNRIPEEARLAIEDLDLSKGRRLYADKCAQCHGDDGQGLDVGLATPAPLWGDRSWNDGAGASRIWTFAGFIRYAMPLNAPGSLTDEESQHIAAWVNSQDRPVFPTKAADYPGGGRPGDAVYDTLVFPVHPLKARLGADRP
ncbi:c-type cytochrome [Gaopeijia maritima]|uniref:C-type cytochrome n=1 Tax=Gaopeijia maritima TaxID=3119007 RepID=A0ABU9EA78_9BACT